AGGNEILGVRELLLVKRGALLDVGLHEQLSGVPEEARDVIHDPATDDEALLVPLLPPRIGEMKVDDLDRRLGNGAREDGARVAVHGAHARAEAGGLQAFIDDRRPLEPDLDAEQPRRRSRGRALEEEAAAAGADLDLERARARDDLCEIDARIVGKA